MNQRRVDFYLGAVGDCLIAVGGRNDTGALSSVEVYYPAEDCWSYVAGLPRYVTYFYWSRYSTDNLSDGRVTMEFGAGFYGPLRIYPHE